MIKKELLAEAPIDNYYESFRKEGRSVIDKAVLEAFQNTKTGLETLFKRIEENKELKKKVNSKGGKGEDISRLNSQNHLIRIGCVFVVGILFLGKYFKNKRTIRELKQLAKEGKQRINENEAFIADGKATLLTEVKMEELTKSIFRRLGFETPENFAFDQVLNLAQIALNFDPRVATDDPAFAPKLLGFSHVSVAQLNNRPIYDVTARILTSEVNFVRSNKKPAEQIEGDWRDSYTKRTPKVETIHWIFAPTNFLSPLTRGMDNERFMVYYTDNERALKLIIDQEKKELGPDLPCDYRAVNWVALTNNSSADIKALDDLYRREVQYAKIMELKESLHPHKDLTLSAEFDDTFPYVWAGSEGDLAKFFDQTAQERILKWFNVNRAAWTNLGWIFMGGDALCLNKRLADPQDVGDVYQYLSLKKGEIRDLRIEEIQNRLVDKLYAYFEEWFNRTQWLFLFPGIGTEWYNQNLYYTTEHDASEPEPVQEFPDNLMLLNMSTPLLTLGVKGALAPWIDLDHLRCFQFSDQVARNDVELCSFALGEPFAGEGDSLLHNSYQPVSEAKIVYTLTKEMAPLDVTFRFDAEHPHGTVDGEVNDLNQLPAVYTELFDAVGGFFDQRPKILTYTTFMWQKNYGLVAINNPEEFANDALEDEFEAWLEKLVA